MLDKVCYLGDDSLGGAAAYLAGIMLHGGLAFDHVPSTESPPEEFGSVRYGVYVVSDYPSARFPAAAMTHVAKCVQEGSGLVMFGGWESYFGRLGEYPNTPLAAVLPVDLEGEDDRRNCAWPCLIEKRLDHEILAGLPWDRPPGIGGFNAFTPKPGAQTLLASVQFSVYRRVSGFEFCRGADAPLLVVGQHGRGRTAALATDVAPHWVGGMVDWGDQRVVQEIPGGMIEVGNWYARFFQNLLQWAKASS